MAALSHYKGGKIMKKFIIYINGIVFSSQCFSTEPTEFGYLDHIWDQEYYESLSMPGKYYYHEYKSSTYPFFSDVSPLWTDSSYTDQDNLTGQAHTDNYLGSYSNNVYTISKHGFIANCKQSGDYYRILVLKENDLVINPTTTSSGIIWTDWNHIYQDSDAKAKWGITDNNARYKQPGLDTYGNYRRLVFFNGSAHTDNPQGGMEGVLFQYITRPVRQETSLLKVKQYSFKIYRPGNMVVVQYKAEKI